GWLVTAPPPTGERHRGNISGPDRARSLVVFRKEFREMFRDKRTVYTVIVSPLLITPALMAFVGTMIVNRVKSDQAERFRIGLASPALSSFLQADRNLSIKPVAPAQAAAAVASHALQAVVMAPGNCQALLNAGRTVPVRILFDGGNENSHSAMGRVTDLFRAQADKLVAARLRGHGLSTQLADPFETTPQPVASGGTSATLLLSIMLPYVLALSGVAGGMYAANDLVAGEKERGSLETLLVTPVSRRDLVTGKFLAVACACLISSLLAVIGILLPFLLPLKAFSWIARGGISISIPAACAILLVQLPLAVLFAGLLIGISTFSRNQKEAQAYLGPLMLLIVVPSMMSMFLKPRPGLAVALVPVLNATMVLKQALGGTYEPLFVAVAFAASALYACAAVGFAARLFESETVLLKS
ncbi:MAG TPA: ABC transporter permease subunit, partial [Chthonomonadales bacterium]|nr:ABC transporter permease subunit [Chthonomonadales bacterium]